MIFQNVASKLRIAKSATFLYRVGLYIESLIHRSYQPVRSGNRMISSPKRDWEERWLAIRSEIEINEIKNILDIGCAEGYFLRCAAEELNCICHGLDGNIKRLRKGEISRLLDKTEGNSAMLFHLTPKKILSLPEYEMIMCLSVAHHLIKSEGYDYAVEFISALRVKSKKIFIFEMGTPEEKSFNGRMPAISSNQDNYVRDFLKDCGFTSIKHIATSISIKRDSERLLFSCN
jgi:hypothetical protein